MKKQHIRTSLPHPSSPASVLTPSSLPTAPTTTGSNDQRAAEFAAWHRPKLRHRLKTNLVWHDCQRIPSRTPSQGFQHISTNKEVDLDQSKRGELHKIKGGDRMSHDSTSLTQHSTSLLQEETTRNQSSRPMVLQRCPTQVTLWPCASHILVHRSEQIWCTTSAGYIR